MDLTLRADKDFPIDAWLRLYQEAGYNESWEERNARAAAEYAWLIVTAWNGGEAIGTAMLWSDSVNFAWIDDVVVHPAQRGRSVGTRLVTDVLARIRAAGIAGVQPFPIPGRESFFARCGFVVHPHATVMDYSTSTQRA